MPDSIGDPLPKARNYLNRSAMPCVLSITPIVPNKLMLSVIPTLAIQIRTGAGNGGDSACHCAGGLPDVEIQG